MAWLPLRQELDLLPGPTLADGQPSWTLHDPLRNQFFRINWLTLEVLRRWDLADPQRIADDIAHSTTLDASPADVTGVLQFLRQHQLLQAPPGSPRQMAAHLAHIEGTPLKWLLHHYLFFRIPLLRPDAWLTRWLPVARLFATPTFLWLTLAALLVGLWQVLRRWDMFTASLVDSFSLEGLLAYGLALFGVKLVHELGHAFTAKHYGCRIPSMGLAFLVMWPVAYTDTNETWRLTDRLQRLRVACAGIATELVVAIWATLAWALLPQGALQSAAFFLATTSWVATLAINASPFMRFDGYFILMDALDLPNLHGRSFALARWKLRQWLFDLPDEPPEHLGTGLRRALIAFAWATWLYRLVLFIGIAVLVYVFFFKLLGVLLFAVEIVWFVLWPIRSELQVWRERWPEIRTRARSRRAGLAMLGLLVLLALPWPARIVTSAMLKPHESWPVFAPAAARVEALPLGHGAGVEVGQSLLTLWVPELSGREQGLQVRLEQQRWHSATAAFDPELRKRMKVAEQTAATTQAELQVLVSERSQFEPHAPFGGRFFLSDPELAVGQWVGRKEPLGLLVREGGRWQVETWLDEDQVARVKVGQTARFWIDSQTGAMASLRVSAVDRDAARVLPRRELAVPLGGHVLTREKNGQLVPERAVYRVTLDVEDMPERLRAQSWRGHLTINAEWESIAARYVRHLFAVLVRELGF